MTKFERTNRALKAHRYIMRRVAELNAEKPLSAEIRAEARNRRAEVIAETIAIQAAQRNA